MGYNYITINPCEIKLLNYHNRFEKYGYCILSMVISRSLDKKQEKVLKISIDLQER